VTQRREDVRVSALALVTLHEGDTHVRAQALDLSGGGFLARTRGAVSVGGRYDTILHLPGGAVVAAAVECVRSVGDREYVFRFVTISARDRETVVREVFRLQRLALARERHA
jgi:c-di-GMP-binding flagellar brake protein YcgR